VGDHAQPSLTPNISSTFEQGGNIVRVYIPSNLFT
jgi:hypothetical protein